MRFALLHAFVLAVCVAPLAVGAAERLENPLAFRTVAGFIEGLLKSIVYVSVPLISLFIVYAGFKFITAQGSSDKLADAKKNFLYVGLGAILILGAWAIAEIVGNTINQLR